MKVRVSEPWSADGSQRQVKPRRHAVPFIRTYFCPVTVAERYRLSLTPVTDDAKDPVRYDQKIRARRTGMQTAPLNMAGVAALAGRFRRRGAVSNR